MHFEKAEKIANLARRKILGGKILSIKFTSKNNPQFAKILIQDFQSKQIAVLVELSLQTSEISLAAALIWFRNLQKQKSKRVEKIWIISAKPHVLASLIEHLQPNYQKMIRIFDEKIGEASYFENPSPTKMMNLATWARIDSEGKKIVAISPQEINVNFVEETQFFTFNGLQFAKIDEGKTYFGVEHQSKRLSDKNWNDLLELIQELRIYRSHNSPNRRHLFYQSSPEAWLESILRKDIKLLEKNLILSPIYPQFRLFADRIDLLALRKDGRLVIIELKTSAFREMVFQSVEYWQAIEKQRVEGNLDGLFGGLKISDEPALIYLVAPHSAFHADFAYLAETIREDIEIWRFDLNENWREKIQVASKLKS
jgi:Endonuclease NucS